MKKKIVKLTSGFLCLLLSMFLFFTVIFMSIGVNLSHKSLNKYIISSGYSSSLSGKILDKLYTMADINNLPHEIFEGFVDTTFITSDIYEYIISMSDDDKENVDNKYVVEINNKKEQLAKAVKDYVLSNMQPTDEQLANLDKNVNDFVDECSVIYKDNFKSTVLNKLYIYTDFIDEHFGLILFLFIFVDIIIGCVLVMMQKWEHRGYRYILYSLISAELMMIILTVYLLINDIIHRVTITSKELYIFATQVLNGCLNGFYVSMMVIAALIFIVGYVYYSKRSKLL